ncbi:hypothetical protein DSB67_24890 [Vibrio campbellii]|uniref:hypothetical protein n=1 Tax=Vibrio campbellii TaxID=680 RepID=UPI00026C49A4|nr:hypothetical protein [Vibrio campbellii]AXB34565.1 hypothetical protein DSB67_24890 [Vibrio campbellii]
MDGGNSVAIKGSTFSKSTSNAGGDKKGVASGIKRTKPCSYKRDHSLGEGKFNGKLELGK